MADTPEQSPILSDDGPQTPFERAWSDLETSLSGDKKAVKQWISYCVPLQDLARNGIRVSFSGSKQEEP
jgi:hypothetical protein